MPIIAVASPKGGVGKSTLSTNIAGYFASRGHPVVLGDADRQQSARLWLKQRPQTARPIGAWEVDADWISAPPPKTTHAVLDTPAGLGGWRLNDALNLADRIIVPLQPSLFDIFATGQYLDELAAQRKGGLAQVAIVGMRVDPRTIVAEKLRNFVDSLGL
ncbi:MAG: ParA family protein, partial [Proteobacteria bacterium]|nr:ParA family protein [Pseudomonadota bacterium]